MTSLILYSLREFCVKVVYGNDCGPLGERIEVIRTTSLGTKEYESLVCFSLSSILNNDENPRVIETSVKEMDPLDRTKSEIVSPNMIYKDDQDLAFEATIMLKAYGILEKLHTRLPEYASVADEATILLSGEAPTLSGQDASE
jgi:hypothetical protein